jgi:epoxide hydrolase-like predicted phosphatase
VIRAVISDFGGVLTTPLFQAFAAYQERVGVGFEDMGKALARATEAAGGRHPLFELEKGAMSEREFLDTLERELGGEVRLDKMSETYFENLHPNEPMIDYMRTLRSRGLRMALLTNNVREWEPLWRAKLPDVDEIFELVVDSAFVGMRKPDPEIYLLTVERLDGVQPEECLFVDDIDVNCHAAQALGMSAVHFRDSDQAIGEMEAVLGESTRKKTETRT